eukprot:TRINITY_DN2844_c0_g1_i15.p1 TRINITY_DN2844_c0_g1~~TRINITY_DN2844_c0_g1_i15.p1  ORF type:complete len:172 (+),score=9.88 TRINITY_DN2844_c0_g1_i15:65-580(+)
MCIRDRNNTQQNDNSQFSMDYFTSNYIRRLIVENDSAQSVVISLSLLNKGYDNQYNYRLPASEFNIIIKPVQTVSILTINKIIPDEDWGIFEYKCSCFLLDGNKKPIINEEVTQPINEVSTVQKRFDLGTVSTNFDNDYSGYKICVACDQCNSPTSKKCSSCDFDFAFLTQ